MKKAVIDLLVLLTFMTGLASAPAGEVGRIPTPNTTALEMTQMMGNGINLGNSMETNGRVTLGTSADVSAYETYWGQPVTTEPMIAGMKESGFDSIRIPIAWTNMMDYEKGDYTIKEPLMARVQQLVDWSLENDMFVIINAHWDGGWWGKFGSATPATREEALKMYKATVNSTAIRWRYCGMRSVFTISYMYTVPLATSAALRSTPPDIPVMPMWIFWDLACTTRTGLKVTAGWTSSRTRRNL